MDKWQVEIIYKDKTINRKYEIETIEDDIIIEYDEKTSTIPEYLYLNIINKGDLNIDISNMDEIYLNKIENGEYLGEQYLFWQSKNNWLGVM
jgi:hypothetical protein